METYNGYANYETWNVALWLQNDEILYMMASMFAEHGYKSLSHLLKEGSHTTHDGVAWDDPKLDIDKLNEVLMEL